MNNITLHATITLDIDDLARAIAQRIQTDVKPGAAAEALPGPAHNPSPVSQLGDILADRSVLRACFLMFDPRPDYQNSWIEVVSSKELRNGWRSAIRWWYPRTRRKGVSRGEGSGHWSRAFEHSVYMRNIVPLIPSYNFRLEEAYREGLPKDIWQEFQDQIDGYINGDKEPQWPYPMAMPKSL